MLYYEVYKLRRLPGSHLWWWGQMKGLASEIMSSLKDHLEQKEGDSQQRVEEPGPADFQSPWRKSPRRRRDTSAQRDLMEAREAHQRALATAAALEEKI